MKPQYADDEASQEVIEGEEAPMSVSISLERDLEEYLVRNLGQLEAGMKLYSKGSTTGRQFNTDTGKVDILASDRTGDFVVIELKAGIANSAALGQVLAYMSWVRQHIAQGKEVRGIIIADDFDTKLKHAVHETPSVCLKKYKVSFTFADIPDDR